MWTILNKPMTRHEECKERRRKSVWETNYCPCSSNIHQSWVVSLAERKQTPLLNLSRTSLHQLHSAVPLDQGSPNYGPRAISGPSHNFIRPANKSPCVGFEKIIIVRLASLNYSKLGLLTGGANPSQFPSLAIVWRTDTSTGKYVLCIKYIDIICV